MAADFLGAFGVVRRSDTILMVGNDRRIGGQQVRTWDLPGGRVESGEMLSEALGREMNEETGLEIVGAPEFLFVQEGEHRRGGPFPPIERSSIQQGTAVLRVRTVRTGMRIRRPLLLNFF